MTDVKNSILKLGFQKVKIFKIGRIEEIAK